MALLRLGYTLVLFCVIVQTNLLVSGSYFGGQDGYVGHGFHGYPTWYLAPYGTHYPAYGEGRANYPSYGVGYTSPTNYGVGYTSPTNYGVGYASPTGHRVAYASYPGHIQGYARYPGYGEGYARYPGYGEDYARYPGYGEGYARYPGYSINYARYPGYGDARYSGYAGYSSGVDIDSRDKRGTEYFLKPLQSSVTNPFGENSVGLALSPWYSYSTSAYQNYKYDAVKHSMNRHAPVQVYGSEGGAKCLLVYVNHDSSHQKLASIGTVEQFFFGGSNRPIVLHLATDEPSTPPMQLRFEPGSRDLEEQTSLGRLVDFLIGLRHAFSEAGPFTVRTVVACH